MTTLIFIIGFLVMVFNEGFVILRHISKPIAQARQNLIKKYGKKWRLFHSIMDMIWIFFVVYGIIFSDYRVLFIGMVLGFWLVVFLFVYLPKLLK